MILRNSPHHRSLKWKKNTWHGCHNCAFFSHILVWNCNFSCNSSLLLLTSTPFSPFSQEVTGIFHHQRSRPTTSAPYWQWWPCWRSPPRWSGHVTNRKLWCLLMPTWGERKNIDSKMPGLVPDSILDEPPWICKIYQPHHRFYRDPPVPSPGWYLEASVGHVQHYTKLFQAWHWFFRFKQHIEPKVMKVPMDPLVPPKQMF